MQNFKLCFVCVCFFIFFNGSDNLRAVAVFFKICTKVTDLLKNNTTQSNCGHIFQSIDFLICSNGLLPPIDYANS